MRATLQKLSSVFLILLLIVSCADLARAEPSTDGTRIGPPSTLTTATGDVWQIDAARYAVRNGVRTAGKATEILWFGGKIWAKAPSAPFNWWTWAAPNKWTNTGSASDPMPRITPSANLTYIPGTADVIIDATGAKWTLDGKLGDDLRHTLKDGQWFAGGMTVSLHYIDGKVYASTRDEKWYLATSTAWQLVADPQPGRNAGLGITITPIEVIPPTPSLAPSTGPKSI